MRVRTERVRTGFQSDIRIKAPGAAAFSRQNEASPTGGEAMKKEEDHEKSSTNMIPSADVLYMNDL